MLKKIFIILIILFCLNTIFDFIFYNQKNLVYAKSCDVPSKGFEESPYYNKEDNSLGLHPTLLKGSANLVKDAKNIGLDIKIAEGFRSVTYQDYLYSQGRTCGGSIVTNAKGSSMESYHMFGLAFDFVFVDGAYDTNKDRNSNGKDDWEEVGSIGESYGLEWGGKWTSFVDLPHFQYTFDLSTEDLKNGELPPEGAELKVGGSTNSDVNSDILGLELYEYISKFEERSLDEENFGNVGINTKKESSGSYQDYKLSGWMKFLVNSLRILTMVVSILIFGYVSLIWMLILLARTHMLPVEEFLKKISLGFIDPYSDLGKMVKVTVIVFLLVAVSASGLMPLVFTLIYQGILDVLNYVF